MTQQTFPAGAAPRLVVTNISGDLEVEGWDEQSIEIEADGYARDVGPREEAFVIDGADDLSLRVPIGTALIIERCKGDVSVNEIAALTLEYVSGDVEIADIRGPVRLRKIKGDLELNDAESLTVEEGVDGDAEVRNVALIDIDAVGGDCEINQARTVKIDAIGGELDLMQAESVSLGAIGGDCEVSEISLSFRYGSIGGDLDVQESIGITIAGGSIGGDLEIDGASSVQLSDVGGDASINDISGNVQIGNIGGDAHMSQIETDTTCDVGNIGGDTHITARGSTLRIGAVGGDLTLSADFPPGSHTQITVGGDAAIELPDEPNLTLRATVGGEVHGPGVTSASGGMIKAVYGEGAAQLSLLVGGDLELGGGDDFARAGAHFSSGNWSEFGKEMEQFGREMGRIGEEIGREMSAAFGGKNWSKGKDWERKGQERAERIRRWVEERVRAAEGRSARRSGRGKRVRVRINDREWRFDPERLERLKEQARKAAQEGVIGAVEAVERALSGMGVPNRPVPPAQVVPPVPPVPPTDPVPPVPPVPPVAPAWNTPATGATMRIDREASAQEPPNAEATAAESAPAPNVEEERAAILRMIAEGRISPEEGDMLLDALG
jgi:hypothetical protein